MARVEFLLDRMHRKREQTLERVQRDAPPQVRLFKRVFTSKASPSECIKAKCLMCASFDSAKIRRCSSPECELWNLRPYQRRLNLRFVWVRVE